MNAHLLPERVAARRPPGRPPWRTGSRRLVGAIQHLVLLLVVLAGCSAGSATENALVLGVHPYLSYAQLQLRFAPLARYIGEHLGVEVEVRIGRDYEEHIRETGRDGIDIAYLGPISYVRVVETYGTKPLLARLERNGQAALTGNIIVADRSPIAKLEDLRGKRLALGDPESTMSSIVPQAFLAESGIAVGHRVHFRGHVNVALAVLAGQADAGAVKSEVYDEFSRRGLRSLHRLPEVSEHLFVTRADLPEALVSRLRTILLSAHETPGGRRALRSLHADATSLTEVTDADYDGLRTMLKAGQQTAGPANANR